MLYYFPDQTDPDYQSFFELDKEADKLRSRRNTDWYNNTNRQSCLRAHGDLSHIAVKDSLASAAKNCRRNSQYRFFPGRYIYVVSWATARCCVLLTRLRFRRCHDDIFYSGNFGFENRWSKMDVYVLNKEKWRYPYILMLTRGRIPAFRGFSHSWIKSSSRNFKDGGCFL